MAASLLIGSGTTALAQVPIEIVHQFVEYGNPRTPYAGLIQGRDGNFYGTTARGGPDEAGTVFRMTPAGDVTLLHAFNRLDGSWPQAALVQGNDGNFYGTTKYGGDPDGSCCGYGTVYKITPDGTFSKLHSFNRGYGSQAALIQATDGNFYGTTDGFPSGYPSSIFRMTPDGVVTTLLLMDGLHGALVQAADGDIYGTTNGPDPNSGTAFRMTLDGVTTVLTSIPGNFVSSLIQATAGDFYGISVRYEGGTVVVTIFKLSTAGTVTVLHSFQPTDELTGGFLHASDGSFYWTTRRYHQGKVFRMTADGTVSVLHEFNGIDGEWPISLVQAADSTIYGTTVAGGLYADGGTVFSVTPAGVFSPLHSFTAGPDGARPTSALVQAVDGNLYGTTSAGGLFDAGTAFKLAGGTAQTVLHSFEPGTDGSAPGGLVQSIDGNFYGTTTYGGTFGRGTVFRMSPDGALVVLHSFGSGTDGATPIATLLAEADGSLYGTTQSGGTYGAGTVFRVTLGGIVSIVYSFTGGADGSAPRGSLIRGSDGFLYGTTYWGGVVAFGGTVFRMTSDGALTKLHDFSGDAATGTAGPTALVEGLDGNFYGTTGCTGGAIFRMTPSGVVTTLRVFPGSTCDPTYDHSPGSTTLMRSRDGHLYGTIKGVALPAPMPVPIPAGFASLLGTWYEHGAVFRIDPSGNVVILHTFDHASNRPVGGLVQAIDGYVYGTTSEGPSRSGGVIFRFRVTAPPPVVTITTNNGAIRLNWAAAVGAASYTVKRMLSGGGEEILATALTSTSYVDTSVTRGQTYHYVVTGVSDFDEGVSSYRVSITAGHATLRDFDGDARSDLAVYRPSNGGWYLRYSSLGYNTARYGEFQWGLPDDLSIVGDFDGDGRTDITAYRPSNGTWYIRYSSSGYNVAQYAEFQWGLPGDVPLAADFDGDGQTDLTAYRPSNGTWYIRYSSRHYSVAEYAEFQWGLDGDLPFVADFDGDGKTDLAVYRPNGGGWFIRYSSLGYSIDRYGCIQWGLDGDQPIPADFDGDGRTDLAVYRPSTGEWFIRYSSFEYAYGNYGVFQWGLPGDVPTLADFDGDGQTDVTAYRPSTGEWYIRYSSQNYSVGTYGVYQWGMPGDVVVR